MAKKKIDLGGGGSWGVQLDPTYINLSDIRTDSALQHRVSIDKSVIDDYTEVLRGGGELASVKLIRDEDGTLWLWDGHQTLKAAEAAGVEQLRAEIERGTLRDAWEKSLGANATHGARRTRNDLAKAIRDAIADREIRYSLLAEDERYTYTSVAELVQTSRKSIRNYWQAYLPEINDEIGQSLAACSDMLVSQAEIVQLVARDLHIPRWVVEQRQIEVAFNLSKPAPPVVPAPPVMPAPPVVLAPPVVPVAPVPPTVGSLEIQPPTVEVSGGGPSVEIEPPAPEPAASSDDFFKRPREDFKHPELPIYRWEPLRRMAAEPDEIEDLVKRIRMMGGSIMEVNDASILYVDAKIGQKREELPLLPDSWGGNTYYVIKLKVKK